VRKVRGEGTPCAGPGRPPRRSPSADECVSLRKKTIFLSRSRSRSPAAVKLEAGGAPDLLESENVLIERGRGGDVAHAQGDVVEAAEGERRGLAGHARCGGRASEGGVVAGRRQHPRLGRRVPGVHDARHGEGVVRGLESVWAAGRDWRTLHP